MKAELYIPYFSYNDDDEKYKTFYKDAQSYIDALHNYSMSESDFMQVAQREEKISYTKCDCILYDEEGNEMDIDKLVSLYRVKHCGIAFELDLATAEEDFLTEFKQWVDEHNRLSKAPEEIRLSVEKRLDFKLIVKNKQNADTYCTFENTLLVDVIDKNQFFALVDKVIFTQNF